MKRDSRLQMFVDNILFEVAGKPKVPKPISAEEKAWKASAHELLLLISLSIISFMISLDATVIVTSLSTIVADLHGTSTLGFWIGTSYLLTSAVTMPFTAALSGIFGRAPCLLSSLTLFTVGSIVCSTAKGITSLLVARSVQGVGGGGIMIISLVIFTDIVPLRHRPQYYGIIQGAWALGTIIGPLIGGAFAQHATWRWNFYLMLPLCGIGFVTIPWLLTLKIEKTTFREKLLRVDWIGGVIFISSTTAFLVALSRAGTETPWVSVACLVPLLLGLVGIATALLWERFVASEPFLRHSLFRSLALVAAYFGATVQGLLLYGQLYYVPLYLLSVKQSSPVRTGVCLLPVLLSLIPASVVVGVLITRFNHFRWAIWLGWILTTLGVGLTLMFDITTPTATWAGIFILLGFGHGLLLNAQNFAAQALCQPQDEASAAAMYMFLRSFGMALGVGIGGTVFQNGMRIKLVALDLPTRIATDAAGYIPTLRSLPDGSVFKTQVLQAYVHGFRAVFAFFFAAAALAGLLSLCVKHADMNKKLESKHVLLEHRWSSRLRDSRLGTASLVGDLEKAAAGIDVEERRHAELDEVAGRQKEAMLVEKEALSAPERRGERTPAQQQQRQQEQVLAPLEPTYSPNLAVSSPETHAVSNPSIHRLVTGGGGDVGPRRGMELTKDLT